MESSFPAIREAASMPCWPKASPLATLYNMRKELMELWNRTNASRERLVGDLQDWSRRAEAPGIRQSQEMSLRLRSYAVS